MKLLFRLTTAAVCALPLLATSRCVSEADLEFALPPATQSGANSFGFVLDGRVWHDYGQTCYAAAPCDSNKARVRYASNRSGVFEIYAGLVTKEHVEYFNLDLRRVKQPGTYTWATTYVGSRPIVELTFADNDARTNYSCRPGSPGAVTITRLDTAQRVISGVFSGTLKLDTDTTKTRTITDGRFDFRYR